MITRTIEKMKQKSETQRRSFAFFVALSVTLVVFSIWLSTFTSTSQKVALKEGEKSETPFKVFKDGIVAAASSFGGIWGGQKVNFQNEYQKMKDQVESGQVQIVPNNQ